MPEIVFEGSPVQNDFVDSEVLENCLMGPRGEGKTEAGAAAMCIHALKQPPEARPIPWAIVRDTWKNLERTTLKSFLAPHPNSFCAKIRPYLRMRDGGKELEFPGLWRAVLFGVDSLGDLSNLQSLQLGGLWVEEPAPAAAEDIGGGMEERVVTVGITSLRHPCHTRLQITQNYPDEDHWSWVRYAIDRNPSRRLFRIPRGANLHVTEEYRQNMLDALQGDQGLLDRLVLGRPGFVVQGEKVTPEYDPDIHLAKQPLLPFPGVGAYRFWDGWQNPACVIAQPTPSGYLQVLWTAAGRNIGVEQLIEDAVAPVIAERFAMIPEWIDVGDPTMATADQSSIATSAARTINRMLGAKFRQGPVDWQSRRNGLKMALTKQVPPGSGIPWLQICPTERILHRALRGGWHYKRLATGKVNDKPEKDRHSHPGDAFGYGVAHILKVGVGIDTGAGLTARFPQQAVNTWDFYGGRQ